MRQTVLSFGIVIVITLACSRASGQFGGYMRGLQGLQSGQRQQGSAAASSQGQSGRRARAGGPSTPAKTAKNPQAGATDRLALIIAMREYPKSQQLPSLPGTDRDALRLAAALQNGKYAEGNLVVVYDDAPEPELRPTRANIDRELGALLRRATESSLVAVFVTGHGVSLAGESYICPGDATDAALADPAKAAQELLSVKGIATRLSKNCSAASKLLVVDACRDTSNDRTSGYVDNVAALEKPAEGVWLMSSCSEGQFSWMSDRIREGERHALFSYSLAEGLEGDADLLGDNDGEVGLFELYTYAFLKTRGAASEIHEVQTPELFGLASPFPVATTGNFVSRRKLTTSDPRMEASRSAAQLADDVLLNLRSADREYRDTVSAEGTTAETVRQSSRVLHRYLCHLLGNRIRTARELDENCRLACVAQGLCYRTCGLYEQALEAFERGGEHFSLFVKAQPEMMKRYIAHDPQGGAWQDESGKPIPRIDKTAGGSVGYACLYEKPGDEKPKYSLQRQQKVRIGKIQGPWLYVTAIDDGELADGGWIHRDEVHWFPEAIDLYTPSSPMRPWGAGGAANRLDYAADGLSAVADALSLPAQAIEQAAMPFDAVAGSFYEAAAAAGEPIAQFNRIAGMFGFGIPNYPANALAMAGSYASLPGGQIRRAAGYARIPAGYVAMAGGYARMPASYARIAQQWSGVAQDYYSGHQRAEQVEESREELKDAGQLEPVEERPILLVELPWLKKGK